MKPRLLQLPADAFSPLALTAGNAGLGAWVRAAAWCVRNETDGILPAGVAFKIAREPTWVKLEEAGLVRAWEEDGIELIGFLDMNPSQAQLAERASVKAKAGAKGGRVAAARRAAPAPFPPPLASSPEALATDKPARPQTQEKPSISPLHAPSPSPAKQETLFEPEPDAPPPPKRGRPKKAKVPPVDIEEPESEHAQIKAAFFEAFVAAKGEEPAWDARSNKALKTLISSIATGPDRVAKVKRIIVRAFDDSWFVEKATTIFVLASNASRYQGTAKASSLGMRQQ